MKMKKSSSLIHKRPNIELDKISQNSRPARLSDKIDDVSH